VLYGSGVVTIFFLPLFQKEVTTLSVSQSLVSEDGDLRAKIPPFYFPLGRPPTQTDDDITLNLAKEYLANHEDAKLRLSDMHEFAKVTLLSPEWLGLRHRQVNQSFGL